MRIAILGPESSGKSTLSKALSQHFGIPLVEEYARAYLTDLAKPYTLEDLLSIAEEQFSLSDGTIQLISDTEMSTMVIWAEEKFKEVPEQILKLETQQEFSLYILCRPDIPWQADALRENPDDRERLFLLYEERLIALSRPYQVVSGQGEARMNKALDLISISFPV